jgi:hypothetical protein
MVDEGLDVESLFEIYITSFYSDFHQEKHYGIERLDPLYLKVLENQLRTICWRWIFHEHRPHGISAGWFSSAGDDASPGGVLCHETMFRHCLFTCMVSTYGFRKNSTMVPRYWFSVDLGTFCPMLDFFPKSSMTLQAVRLFTDRE